MPKKENKSLTGTARYASLNAHSGVEQSRRDDVEALGIVLVYLLKGVLPWQGLNGATKEERFKMILDKKKVVTPQLLCSGLPVQFLDYFLYARKLGFEEKPDYSYLRKLFQDLLANMGFGLSISIEWEASITIESTNNSIASNNNLKQKIESKQNASNTINFNCKSRNELSMIADYVQNNIIGITHKKTLIHLPYANATTKCKSIIEKKYVLFSYLKMRSDEIPNEKDMKIISHTPKVTNYTHQSHMNCFPATPITQEKENSA